MNCRLLFLTVIGIAFLAYPCASFDLGKYFANPFTYETDYSADVLFNAVVGGVKNTGDWMFGNETIRPIAEEVTFWCFDRKTNATVQTWINDTEIASKIDFTKPLYTVTHGWIDTVNRTWVQDTLRDLVYFLDVNACGVDWSKFANYEYSISATKHVPTVGQYLAEFVKYLVSLGISLDNVNLVGHSLGGQISGMAGMHLGGKAGAIWALDPAGPLFCHPICRDIDHRLDKSDAQYVQVIHTTDGVLGCGEDCGHQDFFPDTGNVAQTACKAALFSETLSPEIISCSHSHAIQYFRLALNATNVYTARRCSSSFLWSTWCCELNPTDRLGVYSQRLPGKFYFRSTFRAPFCPA